MSEEDERRKREQDAENKRLMRALKAGDESALSQLMDLNDRRVRRRIAKKLGTTNPDDIDEVWNDVWLAVHRNASRYEESSATFWSWLLKIVRDACVDELRRKKRRVGKTGMNEAAKGVADRRHESPADVVAEKDLGERAMKALEGLSPEEQAAIRNRLEDKSDADLAEETGEKRSTIQARFARALDRLWTGFKKEKS
jgi:RNA polymerase sigma-70 factor (ECF subfamily)